MQLQKGQIVEFDVHALAFGGAGLGKYEGITVFVEGTMPGDKVKASFTRIKEKFAEADLVEITKPSKERIEPRCPYFGTCGGCQVQFMPYEKQLEFKKQHVIDAFERIGKIYNPPVEEIIGSKDSFYYRNKMEFSFGYDEKMDFTLGLHLPGRRYDILDLEECHLQSQFSTKIVNKVRGFMIEKGWLPYKHSNGEGFLRSLYIREGKRTNEVMINLVGSQDVPADLHNGLEEFVKAMLELDGSQQKISSIYFSKVISRRGVPKKIEEFLLHGKKDLHEKMILENGDELDFEILPQAFFQVNTFQAEVLYSRVIELALSKPQKLVLDLFCGIGTIGLFMARHVERVLGVELNEEAIKAARSNAAKNRIFNVDFLWGDTEKVLKNLREKPSLVIVDPPRAGLTQKLIGKISEMGAPEIIYVSCNPATLARDCNWLKEYGYKLKSARAVDMFPHTFHIESVCLLSRV